MQAMKVENLSKAYKLFDTPGKRFFYQLFGKGKVKEFWALKDINFSVNKGETFGIIGKNGSGKSTLLQILAGIIKETSGILEINGRVAALLELGSGFDPECTGYENIFMNAAILGVDESSIQERLQSIIDFAEIGDFINQPVKTYSSGMFVRLAFAVAINVDAEIILIDEALAVGDVFFRQKCYEKLNQLKEQGKTIILVSHSMNEVEQFCDRTLLLNYGKMYLLGDSREVVKHYYIIDQNNEIKKNEMTAIDLEDKKEYIRYENIQFDHWRINEIVFYDLNNSIEINSEKSTLLKVGLFDIDGKARRVFTQGEYAYFYYEVYIKTSIDIPLGGVILYNQKNLIIHGKDSLQLDLDLPHEVESGKTICFLQRIKLDIAVGEYTFDIGIASINYHDYEHRSNKNQEEINAAMERLCTRSKVGNFAVHGKKIGEPMQLMFHGCCDLRGNIDLLIK